VKAAGIEHVGLGSDYGGRGVPIGLKTARGFPLITYHHLKRGYTRDDIKKILGGNLLRVLEESQKQQHCVVTRPVKKTCARRWKIGCHFRLPAGRLRRRHLLPSDF
jgi:hypothetical protein